MVEIFEQKGFSTDDAKETVELMAKYKDFFLDSMMVDELGLTVPDADDNPWIDGLVCFGSFVCFGFMPLAGYVVAAIMGLGNSTDPVIEANLFYISIALTTIFLFVLGAVKSQFTIRTWYYCGCEMVLFGLFTALIAWAIGLGIAKAFEK
jgi:VIT1/CCC1 family predicted Fe2+/Mn2+ transporter